MGLALIVVAVLGVSVVLIAGQQGHGLNRATPQEDATSAPSKGAVQVVPDVQPPETAPQVGISDAQAADFVPALGAPAPGSVNFVGLTMPDGQERRYLYSTPAAFDPQEPLPVLLAMGGWNDPPENFLNYAGFNTSAAASEAVVVYPAGVAGAWAGAPYSETTDDEDISFLRAVVAQLEGALPVDRERIYAVGMSNGGGMALELACHAPDLVAGVAAVSAAFYEGIDDDCRSAPVASQIIHGTDDELLNYGGGILHDTPYLAVEEVVRKQTQRNGCGPQPADSAPVGDNADRLVMQNCAAATEHVRVNGGFHDWFIDPSTPDETWDFLSAQRSENG